MEPMEILKHFDTSFVSEKAIITQLKHEEDDELYQVWRIDSDNTGYILKEAKEYEYEIYHNILMKMGKSAPTIYQTAVIDDKVFLLMEYIQGEDLCKCTRRKLVLALDALISLQKETWESQAYADLGYSFDKSFVDRKHRGEYLNDSELEEVYQKFLEIYASVPRTLCHDDLLPFNIIVSADNAFLIDWEYGGILPYPVSIARLIAHGENDKNALFYMTQEDKEFAIEYYYDNLLKSVGIPHEEWRNTIEYFLFYEYCEWVFVGNKYGNTDSEYYKKYLPIAKRQALRIKG